MRDIRDPQEIGEVLLNRPDDITILEAADQLPAYMIARYGETKEERDERLKKLHMQDYV